jgi:hypothetical protein
MPFLLARGPLTITDIIRLFARGDAAGGCSLRIGKSPTRAGADWLANAKSTMRF